MKRLLQYFSQAVHSRVNLRLANDQRRCKTYRVAVHIRGQHVLKKLIADTDVQFSESFEFDGQEMFKHACGVGLEGVVSKVRDSRYQSGRSNDWARKICAQARDAANLRFCAEGKFDGICLGLPGRTK